MADLIVERKGSGKWHIVTKTSSLMSGDSITACLRRLPYGCGRAYLSEIASADLCQHCAALKPESNEEQGK